MGYISSSVASGYGSVGCGCGCQCRPRRRPRCGLGEIYLPGALEGIPIPRRLRLPEPMLRPPVRPRLSLGIPPLTLQTQFLPQPPPPPQIDLRLNCDAMRAADICLCPRTEEERLNCRLRDILKQQTPAGPRRRSFSELFFRKLDDALDGAMRRLNLPDSVRGPVRKAARAAVEKGTSAALNAVMDQLRIRGDARDAIRSTIRGVLETPAL